MANQDLLYAVLPRPPAAPGSVEFKRVVNQINAKTALARTQVEEEPRDQDDGGETHAQGRHTEPAGPVAPPHEEGPLARGTAEGERADEDGHIDLYV